jgi:hypothetical protein
MTTFKQDWKTAKTAFTAATQKKKPSATLLGFFDKGPGISSALESADKAKTAGELHKAMTAFQTSYTDYLKTLDKAVADPKVTPVADKTVYANEVKKLKAALQAIHQSADRTMQSLVDAGAKMKDKVDPAELRKSAERAAKEQAAEKTFREHTARRVALAQGLAKVLQGYKSKGIEAAAANAVKQAQAAKAAKAQGNTMGADVAAQTSARFAEQAADLMAEITKDWNGRSQKGEMIELRGDSGVGGDLAPSKAAAIKKEGAAAWEATEKVQREVQVYLAALRSVIARGDTAAESADAFRIGATTLTTYLKRIADIKTRLDALKNGVISKYAQKVATVRSRQEELSKQPAKTPEETQGRKKMWHQLKAEHQNAVAQAGQTIEELKETQRRLEGIPQDDKAVAIATVGAAEVLVAARKLADFYAEQGPQLIKELDTYLTLR